VIGAIELKEVIRGAKDTINKISIRAVDFAAG
jgi:hypothetical protein